MGGYQIQGASEYSTKLNIVFLFCCMQYFFFEYKEAFYFGLGPHKIKGSNPYLISVDASVDKNLSQGDNSCEWTHVEGISWSSKGVLDHGISDIILQRNKVFHDVYCSLLLHKYPCHTILTAIY